MSERSIEQAVEQILRHIGEDTEREGLIKTPTRVARSLEFLTRGYDEDPKTVINGALFTEDGIFVPPAGPLNGRQAIEEWYRDLFQGWQPKNHLSTVDPDSPHAIGTAGNQMWATGEWSTDIKGKDFGPVPIKGYWSVIREGDDWKIRMLTSNSTPAPAK